MSDHYLVREQQLAMAIQAAQGTAETLDSGDVLLKPFRSDTPFTPDYSRFTNDEVAEDIAQAADFVAGKKGRIGIGCNLKTSGVVGTAPALGLLLRGCAMKEQDVKSITIGAISGGDSAFSKGDTYSATGGKAGIIDVDISSSGTLYYIPTSGGDLADSDVVTSDSDTATCSGASSEYATKYSPRSTGQEILTLSRAEKNDQGTSGQDIVYKLRDAMGAFSLNFTPGDVGKFNGEFSGVVESIAAGDFFTGYTYEASSAPNFMNATVQIDGVAVQIGEFALNSGNSVEMELDPTTTGGTAGYDQARVAYREPTITMAPSRQPIGTLDTLAMLLSAETFPILISFGTSPNKIKIAAPAAQIRADGLGERAGRRTDELTIHLCRSSTITDGDWEIYFM